MILHGKKSRQVSHLKSWKIELKGPDTTLYQGETFQLQVHITFLYL